MKAVIFLVLLVVKYIPGAPTALNGNTYISLDLKSTESIEIHPRQLILQLRFRTIHPNRLLMYSKGASGQYFRLEIIQGRVSYSSYFHGSYQNGLLTILSPNKDLNDDKWHNVTLIRHGRKFALCVDKITAFHIHQGEYGKLDINDVIYVGGMTEQSYHSLRVTGSKNFRGCLRDVKYGNVNILAGAVMGLHGFEIHKKISFQCKSAAHRIFSSISPNLSVRIPYRAMGDCFFTTSFQFRTYFKEGYFISVISPRVKSYLFLSNGVLVLKVVDVSGFKSELRLGTNLNDGEWHQLSVRIAGSEIVLQLDGQVTTKEVNNSLLSIRNSRNKLRPKISLGKERKMKSNISGFVGCILDLIVQDRQIPLSGIRRKKYVQSVVMKSCHLENYCEPNPCKNGGQCSQDWKQFYCKCDHTDFEGEICEISIYKPTCEHYRFMGLQTSALCLLDSKGEGHPYTAFCNVTRSSRTYTIIAHNKMAETPVGDGELLDALYSHEITYTVRTGMDQIKALIEKSKHCRQYVEFHCFASKLFNAPRGSSQAFWLSRDKVRQEYWGGGQPGSKKCACGMTEPPSCVGKKFCNCDARDRIWRVDAGYLRDKSTVPVTGLLFNKKSKKSDFRVGPLECWGTEEDSEASASFGENLNEKQVDRRLKRVCLSESKSEKKFVKDSLESPQFSSTTLEQSQGSPSNITSVTANASQNFSILSENKTFAVKTLQSGNLSLDNSQKANAMEKTANTDKNEETGLSTMAIVVISFTLTFVISFFIVFDRINRKFKSPFPCRYFGAKKVDVAD